VVLVSLSEKLELAVQEQIELQLEALPRKDIASKAIENSKSIMMDSSERALELVNAYAPEHLIVCLKDSDSVLSRIANAGSVFVGNYTPESAGDYASGTNHTLPTNGFARNFSGVNLDSFQKAITFQEITKSGLQGIGGAIEQMAEAEGLRAHRNAVTLRLEKMKQDKS
jgi:histidinol dehydrogenase